jgi:hypothetical protein
MDELKRKFSRLQKRAMSVLAISQRGKGLD